MAIFKKAPHPSQDPLSSLRTPATKRISASQRLSTILETHRDMPAPTVPLRSILRNKNNTTPTPMPQHPAFRSQETLHSAAPPAYGYHTSSIAESEDLTAPVEGEKLAQLRRGQEKQSRGGWKRLALILLVILVIIGLAVGLGVGLTVGRRSSNSQGSGSSSDTGNTSTTTLPFPLGQYSFVTALRTQQTNCTSAASSWRCYPYTTFAASNQTSLAALNWILTNTSAEYATQNTGSTLSAGVPANLSISSTNNAFSIVFSNQNLTYISDVGNSSSARYAFSFTLPKVVIPIPAITSDNAVSRCYYNSTLLEGIIWLNRSRTYPDPALYDNNSIGGYEQWPYAVEVAQISPGGSGIPDCYKTVNGVDGDRIVNVLTAQPTSSQCICDYSNF